MVPLHKLARLPRHQRLRKIAKIAEEAERALPHLAYGVPYLSELAAMAASDPEFSAAAARDLGAAAATLSAEGRGPADRVPGQSSEALGRNELRRALNTLRHLLSAEIGRIPADWDFVDGDGVLNAAERRVLPGVRVYLEDLRSPFNVGSLFRTAESFGVERLYLSPLCADPQHPRAQRSAMGCTAVLPWERLEREALTQPLFALETGGTELDRFPFPAAGTMIVGSEELGVSPATLEAADRSLGRVSIPTFGAKGSLNVAVAFGIAMRAWAAALTQDS